MRTVPWLVSSLSVLVLAASPAVAAPTPPGGAPALPASYTVAYLDGMDGCADPGFTAVSPSGTRVAADCERSPGSGPRLFVQGKSTPFASSADGTAYTISSITYVKDNGVMGGIAVPPGADAKPLGAVWMKPNTLRVGPTGASLPAGKRFTDVSGVDAQGNAMLISRIRRNDAYLWWKADGTATAVPQEAWLHEGNADGTFYAGEVGRNIIAGKRQGSPVTWEAGRGLRDLQIDAATDTTFPAGQVDAMSPGPGRIIGSIHVYSNQTKQTTSRSVELFEASAPVALPLSPAASGVAVVAINNAGVMVGEAYTEKGTSLPRMLDEEGRRLRRQGNTRPVVMNDKRAEWLDTKVKGLPAGAQLSVSHLDSRGRVYVTVTTGSNGAFTHRLAILTPGS